MSDSRIHSETHDGNPDKFPRSALALLEDWYDRSRKIKRGHYHQAHKLEKLHYIFGTPVIILSTLVGTSTFANLAENPRVEMQILAGLMSLVAAILAALQTFLRLNERATAHHSAGARYAGVLREIETILAIGDESEAVKSLESIRDELDILGKESPHLPKVLHTLEK